MSWEKKWIARGEGLLASFDRYNTRMKADNKRRRELRRTHVQIVDRTFALMIDFMIVLVLFSGVMLSSSQDNMIIGGVMIKLVEDPAFTGAQAMQVLIESGALRTALAQTMSQFTALALIVLPSLYFLQATPGMYLLGIPVRRADRQRKAGLIRYVLFFISGALLLGFFMVSYLGILFRRDKRALHDVLCGVVLLRRRVIEEEKQQRILEEAAAIEAGQP